MLEDLKYENGPLTTDPVYLTIPDELPAGAIGFRVSLDGNALACAGNRVNVSEYHFSYSPKELYQRLKIVPQFPATKGGIATESEYPSPLPALEREAAEADAKAAAVLKAANNFAVTPERAKELCEAPTAPASGLVDSGERTDLAGTGALRENNYEKQLYRYDLIPPIVIKTLAEHYGRGSIKYADRNWQKGLPISNFYRAIMSHLMKWALNDVSENHLAAILWNAAGILWTEDAVSRGILPYSLLDMPYSPDYAQSSERMEAEGG